MISMVTSEYGCSLSKVEVVLSMPVFLVFYTVLHKHVLHKHKSTFTSHKSNAISSTAQLVCYTCKNLAGNICQWL